MAETIMGNIQEALQGFLAKTKLKLPEPVDPEQRSPGPLETIGEFAESREGRDMLNFPGMSALGVPVAGLAMAKTGVKAGITAVTRMSNARAKILAAEGSIKAMSAARKAITGIGEKPLEELMKSIPNVAKKATVKEEKLLSTSERVEGMWNDLKERAGLLWDGIKSPITGAEWDPLIRKHVGVLQYGGMKTSQFEKELIKKYPDKLRREALLNYVNFNGDEGKLLEWSRQGVKGTKAGYKQALSLTEEEKEFGKKIRVYFDEMHDKAMEEGFVESYVTNYLPGLYKRNSKAAGRLQALTNASSSLLGKTPFFSKEKHYATYADAEKSGELIAKNKDIGYLITTYQNAFDKALATKTFMRELLEGTAKDGRPLAAPVGYTKILEGAEAAGVNPKMLIKPRGTAEQFFDYQRGPENAAFRKWKWAGKDTMGNDALMDSELKFHPEIATKINNIFGKSAIRESTVGRALLNVSSGLKGVLLGPSFFHPVQVSVHAIFHSVNPFTVAKIDPDDPMVRKAVEAGVMLYDHAKKQLFSEGVTGGGYLSKIPGAGPYVDKWNGWLFENFIPRLKMAMYKEAYARNMKRYGGGQALASGQRIGTGPGVKIAKGKLSEQQIAMLTADQSNAAFGELNYTALGRNKTFQDVLRLTLLAPDFLEARARFAGQALRGIPELVGIGVGGKEQLMAAGLRGSAMMFMSCQTTNYLLNGKIYPDKPFSIIVDGREFVTRSVPGDMLHFIKDPGSFSNHRLNPTTIRTAIIALQHRNTAGKWMSVPDMVTDFFQRQKPIPFQKTADQKWYQAALNSMGVTDIEERTVALKEALKIRAKTPFTQPTQALSEKSKTKIGYVKDLNKAKSPEEQKEVMGKIGQERKEGKLNKKDMKQIVKQSHSTDLQRAVKPMPIEDALYVWQLGTDEEKLSLGPILLAKTMKLSDDRRASLQEPIKQFVTHYQELSKQEKKAKDLTVLERLKIITRGKSGSK